MKGKTQTWMERVAKHPLIMLSSLGVAVVALLVMVLLFFISQDERELVYAINPIKTRVAIAGQATGLELLHQGVRLGSVDITAAQVAIWNSGDGSIKKENILKGVEISTNPPVRILEASIVKSSRDLEITHFGMLESRESMDQGKVSISWDILEKDDGASIQLIYLGLPEVDIKVEGLIEGVGEIKRVGPRVKIKTPAEQFESAKTPWWIIIALIIGVGATTLAVVKTFIIDIKRKKKHTTFMIFGIFIILALWLLVGFSLWDIFGKGPMEPPFGF